MLLQLRVKDLAIIEEQEISFGPGLNVITGETGAGKSILLQALELVLGAKPKGDIARTGSDGWLVEAVLDLKDISPQIRSNLPDLLDSDEVILSRSSQKSGKGRVYVNGHLASLNVLQDLAQRLVNICGQGQFVSLLDSAYHLELIDGYAQLSDELAKYRESFQVWSKKRTELREIEEKVSGASRRRVELEILLEELRPLNLTADLRFSLEEQVRQAAQNEKAVDVAQSVLSALNTHDGIYAQIRKLQSSASELQKLGFVSADDRHSLEAASDQIAAFEAGIERAVSACDLDSAKLEELRESLAEVARLERKFRLDSAGLYALWQSAEKEYLSFESEENIDARRKELQTLEMAVREQATSLSSKRKDASKRLGKLVVQELKELNLAGAQLEISFKEKELSLNGIDTAEILIATNTGEQLRPLKQVASGGELSRILLVLKKVLKDKTGVNVLIFDEVDSGVSGKVARAVGEKLKALAQGTQVICITHLPQVASLADRHLLVEKRVRSGRTVSEVVELSLEERVEELARMLSGHSVSESARASAREMLEP
jgi:DNA repair protein RecN (Recombination protein N)